MNLITKYLYESNNEHCMNYLELSNDLKCTMLLRLHFLLELA